jgi:hypothetical protein
MDAASKHPHGLIHKPFLPRRNIDVTGFCLRSPGARV